MPSKITPKKSPVRAATKSDAASLLESLSKDEIKFILNFRSLDIAIQEHLERAVQTLHDDDIAKARPALSIVRTASISSIGGGLHA